MSNLKLFSRTVRQEINRISISLKQIEFKSFRVRGLLKKRLRQEIQELKRMKDAIMQRLLQLTSQAQLHAPTMQSIREDIEKLHTRFRSLKTQYF